MSDPAFPSAFLGGSSEPPEPLRSVQLYVPPIKNALTKHHSGAFLLTRVNMVPGEHEVRPYPPLARMTTFPFRVYEFPFQDGSWPIYARTQEDSHPPASFLIQPGVPPSHDSASYLMWRRSNPPQVKRLSLQALEAAGFATNILFRTGDFVIHTAGESVLFSLTSFNRTLGDLLVAV